MRYVFDLDGTICTQETSDSYWNARPIPEMVAKIRELKKQGHEITIYTARGMSTFDNDRYQAYQAFGQMTQNWLLIHDVPHDFLFFGKPAGDVYVDDKSVTPQEFLYHAE